MASNGLVGSGSQGSPLSEPPIQVAARSRSSHLFFPTWTPICRACAMGSPRSRLLALKVRVCAVHPCKLHQVCKAPACRPPDGRLQFKETFPDPKLVAQACRNPARTPPDCRPQFKEGTLHHSTLLRYTLWLDMHRFTLAYICIYILVCLCICVYM